MKDHKGPSDGLLNDVASKGEGRGIAKMGIWGDFQGLTEATGGGRGAKNAKIEATSFMDGP